MDPVLAEQVVSFSVAMLVGAILWAIGAVVLRSALGLTGLLLGGILGGIVTPRARPTPGPHTGA